MHDKSCNCLKCNNQKLTEYIMNIYKRQKQEELSKNTTDKNKDGK